MTPFDPIYEGLAKEAVYGFNRPDVQQQVVATLAQFGYTIDQTFVDPATGFQAFGLVGQGRPPVLVFRGGDEPADDPAFADRNSVGFNQFTANRQAILDWITKFNNLGVRPDIVGHSLGGAIAQITASEFPTQVGNVVTFNSPGINRSVATQFQQRGGNPQQVTHYIVNGDFVSLAGEAFIPGDVQLQSYTDLVTVNNVTYEAIDPVLTLDKHREKTLRFLTPPPLGAQPPDYRQSNLPIDTLNSPQFNFRSDADFEEFIAAYRPINAQTTQVADALNSRQTTELLRTSPNFSFFGLVFQARAFLNADQPNLLVGNDRDNFANGGRGNDRIFGRRGNDLLRGGADNDRVLGEVGRDLLFGDAGNDTLIGGRQNDVLSGGAGSDVLIGVNPGDRQAGRGEVDQLTGNGGNDTFVLGVRGRTFYNSPGSRLSSEDFALITDFRRGDRIQLRGSADNYQLQQVNLEQGNGIGIFLRLARGGELIGVVQGNANLPISAFRFV